MQYKQRFPWISLALLILAYSAFGWHLFSPEAVRFTWIAIEVFILILALLLTMPLDRTGIRLLNWTSSSGGVLILVLFLSFILLLLLLSMHVVTFILIVTAASALARLGMQTIGLRQWQVFLLLISCSFLGLGVGWASHEVADLWFAGSAVGTAVQQWVEAK